LRSAQQLVGGVLVGGGVPEFGYLAVTQVIHVCDFLVGIGSAAPAGGADNQRDSVLIVG
jgi:hypothetical protein